MPLDFSEITAAIDSGKQRFVVLDAETRGLKERVRALRQEPLNRNDAELMLKKSLADSAAEALASPEVREQCEYLRKAAGPALDGENVAALAPIPTRDPAAMAKLLFALLDQTSVIKALSKSMDALDWEQAGLPLDKRAKEIAHHQKALDKLQSEQAALAANLRAAGVEPADLLKPEAPKEGDQLHVTDVQGQRWTGTWTTQQTGTMPASTGYHWRKERGDWGSEIL